MRKLFLLLVFASTFANAQNKDDEQVRKLLLTQSESWNKGDIVGMMQTYWQSDSLMFIAKSGITRGWNQTLAAYKRNYPDAKAMGQLSFDNLHVKRLSPLYYYVVGKYLLKRETGDRSGHFALLLQKINGRWVIISDHSS
ncbi:MAG: YybH family protein [Candidatus Dadabacteria bacterium]